MDGRSPRLADQHRSGKRGAQVTLLEYLGAIDAIVIRRDALEKIIAELIPGSPWAQRRAAAGLRGVDTLSAVGLCAEVGEFARFAKAAAADEPSCVNPRRLADVGLSSSASRSALRAAGSVTAAPTIRWVAARSGRAPTIRGSSR